MDTEAQPHVGAAAAENGNGNGAHHNNDKDAEIAAEPGMQC